MNIASSLFDPTVKHPGLKDFDCGLDAINRFARHNLSKQVRQGVCVAYALLDTDDAQRLVGFVTLANHSIELSRLSVLELGSMPRTIPCTRVVMLGVTKSYQQHRLGQQLIKIALQAAQASAVNVGSFGVYLDADANAVGFYQKLGFVLLQGNQSPDPSPMFLSMSSIA